MTSKGAAKGSTPLPRSVGLITDDFARQAALQTEAVRLLDLADAKRAEMAEGDKELERLGAETRKLISKMQAA